MTLLEIVVTLVIYSIAFFAPTYKINHASDLMHIVTNLSNRLYLYRLESGNKEKELDIAFFLRSNCPQKLPPGVIAQCFDKNVTNFTFNVGKLYGNSLPTLNFYPDQSASPASLVLKDRFDNTCVLSVALRGAIKTYCL